MVYTTHISYLEIYNDVGYDLLDPRHEASHLEDLPSVSSSVTIIISRLLLRLWPVFVKHLKVRLLI